MKRKNEWEKLAVAAPTIQKTKNDVLNAKVLSLIKVYTKKGASAFDYGCGWGEFAQLLSDNGYPTKAFDQSDEMVQLAKSKFKNPDFLFREEVSKSKKDLKEQFDVVISNLVLCILTQKDQDAMLKNIKQLVKKDGKIILSFCHPCFDYHAESIVSLRSVPENARYDQEFEYEKEIKENGMKFHDFHRSLAYYSKLFKKHGLRILEIGESDIRGSRFYPDFVIFVLEKI